MATCSSPCHNPGGLPKQPTLTQLNRMIVDCRRCPRLVAHRESVAVKPPPRYHGQRYWARALPGFGDPDPQLLLVGLALRRAPPRRLRQPAVLRASRRRPRAARRLHHGRDPLRATPEQADARRDRALRAVPLDGAPTLPTRPRGGRAGTHRLASVPARPARTRRAAAPTRAAVRPRRPGAVRRRRDADRVVSSEPAEHLHGQADATDAAGDLRDGPESSGVTASPRGPWAGEAAPTR
jgi:hypothetical protein